MNQDYVTRLVVGPSICVALGQRVVATGRGREGLRLEGTDWVPAGSKQPATKGGMQPTGLALAWQKILSGRAAQFGAGGVALVLIAGTCAALFWPQTPATRPAAATLPIAPASQSAAPAAAMTMVSAPYEPAPPLPTASSPVGQGGLSGPVPRDGGAMNGEAAQAPTPAPVHLEARTPAHPTAPIAAPAPTRAQAAQPEEGPARAKASPPAAPTRSDKEKGEKAAVIMDDVPMPKANPTPAPQAPSPQTVAKAPAPTPAPVPGLAPAAAAKPAQPRGIGLLAIAPDGKSAAFTNPKTRLPEQFKIGDQLPNGETVRSIDLKGGRVVTNAKEYGLE
jgi:hypothetical protein